jgi:hypothetical protein
MGLDTMPEHAVRSKAVITATAAELFVSDIKASCDFFTRKLGFAIVFVIFPVSEKRAVGCLDVHRQGSGRKPVALRRSGGMKRSFAARSYRRGTPLTGAAEAINMPTNAQTPRSI